MNNSSVSPPTQQRLFFHKFASSFFPLLFTTGIVAIISVVILLQQSYHSITQNNNNLLIQAQQNINMLFSNVDSIALSIGQNTRTLDEITEIFEDATLNRESKIKTEQYRRFVSSITNSNPYIFSIYVYANNSNGNFLTSADEGISNLNSFYDTDWYASYQSQKPGIEIWSERRSVQRYSFDDPLEFISVYRTVYPLGMRRDGVIVQNVEIKFLKRSLSNLDFSEKQ